VSEFKKIRQALGSGGWCRLQFDKVDTQITRGSVVTISIRIRRWSISRLGVGRKLAGQQKVIGGLIFFINCFWRATLKNEWDIKKISWDKWALRYKRLLKPPEEELICMLNIETLLIKRSALNKITSIPKVTEKTSSPYLINHLPLHHYQIWFSTETKN
jgi:hypothetical protein